MAYKLILTLLVVGLAAAGALLFLAGLGAIAPQGVLGDGSWGQRGAEILADMSLQTRVATTAVAGVASILTLTLLARSWRPSQPATALHMLDVDDRGVVVVDSRGIAVIARQAALSAHGVVDAEVSVRGSGTDPISVQVEIDVYPGSNIKRAGTEVRAMVAKSIDELVGLTVQDVMVRAQVIESNALSRVLA